MKMRFSVRSIAAIVLLAVSAATADVQLPNVFSHHMVLQRDMAVPVWGSASPGEAVMVKIADQSHKTTADEKGHWRVNLEAMSAGGPYEMTVLGNERHNIVFGDIMVGDVWICSGQSNMQWNVARAANATTEIAEANYPNIRLFSVARRVASQPMDDCPGQWVRCSPANIPDFSAVGYYFGRHLHKELKIAIGLIHTSWGGTPAEAWTSREKLTAHPQLEGIVERWDQSITSTEDQIKSYPARYKDWAQQAEALAAQGKSAPEPPKTPSWGPRSSPHRASGLYNAMIHPLLPFGIRGAIWYQGESNAGRAYQYRTLFPAMITDWRERWGQGDFPFLFVQLANYTATKPQPADSEWAELREAQLMTLSLPKTGMAVTIDIGQADNIHPTNKQDVGKRLALNALAITYGRDAIHTGPMFEKVTFDDSNATLTFKNVGDGLKARASQSVEGFAVAGEDRVFHWATAKIVAKNSVVLKCEQVAKPVAVRYAWANNPVCNLIDSEGLPASPFRTDDWLGVTQGKE